MKERLLSAAQHFYHSAKTRYMNLSIRQKQVFTYCVLVILPMLILTAFFNVKSSRILQENAVNSAQNLMKQDIYYLNRRISTINQLSNWVLLSSEFSGIIFRNPDKYTLSEQLDDEIMLSKYLATITGGSQDIFGIRIYFYDNLIYSNTNYLFFNMETIKASKWYQDVSSRNGGIYWSNPIKFKYAGRKESELVSAARVVKDIKGSGEVVGILSLDIEKKQLENIINTLNISKGSSKFLVSPEGDIIVQTPETAGNKTWEQLRAVMDHKEMHQMVELSGQKFLVEQGVVEGTDWRLVFLIPGGNITETGKQMRNSVVIVMVPVSIIAIFIAYLISTSDRKRITNLTEIMGRVQEDGFNTRVTYKYNDEIDKLRKSCDYMIQNTKDLMEEKFKLGKEIRSAELKALQAQINPHFLYNTLELINWTAETGSPSDVQILVNSLARYYKLSLSRGKEFVPIRDEIEHLIIYVNIQNLRFEDSISLVVDIEEEVYNRFIIKMVLQPLVENAISHGIREKDAQDGTVWVSGRLADESVILEVKDDGVGISQEKIEEIINCRIQHNSFHGYGVKNIFERLRLYYGKSASLKYESIEGAGTIVTLIIPSQENYQ